VPDDVAWLHFYLILFALFAAALQYVVELRCKIGDICDGSATLMP
jgi:hypothetical protein